MSLTHTPDELLHEIVSRIDKSSDLAAISLVSRRLNDIAEPKLRRHILLNVEPCGELQIGYTPTTIRQEELLRQLEVWPELDKHTEAFSFRVAIPSWSRFLTVIDLIKHMTGLRQLSCDPPPFTGWCLPNQAKKLTNLRLDFSHVTSHYDSNDYKWLEKGEPLKMVVLQLKNKSLRKLQVQKLFFTHRADPDSKQAYGWSLVEDLRFLDCCPHIDGDDAISEFIKCIKHLKCFVVEFKSPWDAPAELPGGIGSYIDFRPALELHSGTIEELAVSTTPDVMEYYNFGGVGHSFKEWTALKRLAVPIVMLFGDVEKKIPLHEMLPAQLEELQLEENLWHSLGEGDVDERENYKLFTELAVNKDVWVPGLKHLIWWIQKPSTLESSDTERSISELIVEKLAPQTFKHVGVKFECISTLCFKDTPFGKRLYEWN